MHMDMDVDIPMDMDIHVHTDLHIHIWHTHTHTHTCTHVHIEHNNLYTFIHIPYRNRELDSSLSENAFRNYRQTARPRPEPSDARREAGNGIWSGPGIGLWGFWGLFVRLPPPTIMVRLMGSGMIKY